MGRIVVTEYISVDGVVEAPSGSESFARVGWTDAFARGPEATGSSWTRRWPRTHCCSAASPTTASPPSGRSSKGEFADKFNTMPKYVVSSTLTNPEWNNTTVLRGDVVEEVTKLKQRYERDIVVHGSPQLAQTLIEHDLVDALHLQIYPVIVGAGKRLFGDTSQTKRLRLTETKTVGDVHILIYERAA